MNFGDTAIVLSVLVCFGIVFGMLVKMKKPVKFKVDYAEIIKKNQFVEKNFKENGIRVVKTLYSISFMLKGKKKSFYCEIGLYDRVEVGDKVKIVYNDRRIIDVDVMKNNKKYCV